MWGLIQINEQGGGWLHTLTRLPPALSWKVFELASPSDPARGGRQTRALSLCPSPGDNPRPPREQCAGRSGSEEPCARARRSARVLPGFAQLRWQTLACPHRGRSDGGHRRSRAGDRSLHGHFPSATFGQRSRPPRRRAQAPPELPRPPGKQLEPSKGSGFSGVFGRA